MLVNGRNDHFQEIFNRYYPSICRQIAYIMGSTDLVEDIAQEAFVKLYYSSPRELTNIGGWLAKVAANLCYDYLRREKNRKQKENDLHMRESVKVIPLEETVLRNQEVRRVREIMEKLNERDRMALLLRFSGFRYQEIAEVIEVEVSSVGTILARAQKKFKDLYLEKEGGIPRVL